MRLTEENHLLPSFGQAIAGCLQEWFDAVPQAGEERRRRSKMKRQIVRDLVAKVRTKETNVWAW